jgi:protocatechuate 3,4-dioxygenase, alpha subunit
MMIEKPSGITPSQTVGPFFHYMLTPHSYPAKEVFASDLTMGTVVSDTIEISGRVLDADGAPMADAYVEIWQADAAGKYATTEAVLEGNHRPFHGFGRCDTDKDGGFRFKTIKPGSVRNKDGTNQAPHIAVNLFGRGMLKHLTTRFYFADEQSNRTDAILNLVPAERRETLLLQPDKSGIYRLDIRLGGKGETVFFAV